MTTIKTTRRIANLQQGRNDWYRIQSKMQIKDELGGGMAAEIYIYDEIGYFGVTAADFIRDLQAVDDTKIILHLNSPGGDVFDGLAIYNGLRNHKADVTVRIEGIAASAASFIAMSGDKIIAEKASEMMIHDARAMAIGVNAAEMQDLVHLLNKNSDIIANVYADRAGGTQEAWRAAMLAETWYNSDEMLAAGLIDEIAGTETKVSNTFDLSIFNHPDRASASAPALSGVQENKEFELTPEFFRSIMKEAAK